MQGRASVFKVAPAYDMRKARRNRAAGSVEYYDKEGAMVLPSSIGQQVFVISSGIAGGLAGFLLAYRVRGATHLKVIPLVMASLVSATATFAAIFLITEAER